MCGHQRVKEKSKLLVNQHVKHQNVSRFYVLRSIRNVGWMWQVFVAVRLTVKRQAEHMCEPEIFPFRACVRARVSQTPPFISASLEASLVSERLGI